MDEFDELMQNAKAEKENGPQGHRQRVYASVDRDPDMTAMADYEMLEYLLFATIPRGDIKPIAKDLIRTFGSLSAVLHADYCELLRVPGLGSKSAHLLAHVLPIVIRAEYGRFEHATRLTTAAATARFLYARFLGENKEKLLMVSLNVNDEVIHTDEIAYGSVDSMQVDIAKIVCAVERNGAKKIILAHNHPGGTLNFSDADIETTARVITACTLVGVVFVDHQILVGNRYISMFGDTSLDKVLAICDKYCAKLTESVAAEKSRHSLRMHLREQNDTEDANRQKLQALQTYRQLLLLDTETRQEIEREWVRDIADEKSNSEQ